MGDVPPLTPDQNRALARLSDAGVLRSLYLVGGVAVAFHLRHRRSIDLDLFSREPDLDLESVRRDAVAVAGATTVSQTDVALMLRIGRTPVDVVRYPYRRLGRLVRGPGSVQVAGLRDLAAMKVAAIARRGIRRDFWDLHEILTRTRLTLRSTLADYRTKYGIAESDVYHVVKSMTWFEDADHGPPPAGLSQARWSSVKAWYQRAAPAALTAMTSGRRR